MAGTSPWVRNGSLALAVTGIVAAVALSQVHPPAADGQAQARNVGESSTASTAASVIFQPDWLTTDAVIEGYLDGSNVDGHKVDGGSGGLFDSNSGSGDALFASNGGTVVNGPSDDGNIVDADGSGSVVARGAAGNVPAAGGSGPAGDPSSGPSALFSMPNSNVLAEKGDGLSATQQPVTELSGPASSDQSDGEGMQALSGTPDAAPGSASGAYSASAPATTEGDGTAAALAPSESAETTPAPAPTGSGETSQTQAPTEGPGTPPTPTAEPTSPSPEPTSPSPEPTSPSPEPTASAPESSQSTSEPTSPSSAPTTSTPAPTSTTLKPVEPTPEPATTSPESTTSSPAPTGAERDGWIGYDGAGSSKGGNAGWADGDESDPEDRDGNDWNYRYGNN